jgi:hypothetical protein
VVSRLVSTPRSAIAPCRSACQVCYVALTQNRTICSPLPGLKPGRTSTDSAANRTHVVPQQLPWPFGRLRSRQDGLRRVCRSFPALVVENICRRHLWSITNCASLIPVRMRGVFPRILSSSRLCRQSPVRWTRSGSAETSGASIEGTPWPCSPQLRPVPPGQLSPTRLRSPVLMTG